jgi:hypothetical protein
VQVRCVGRRRATDSAIIASMSSKLSLAIHGTSGEDLSLCIVLFPGLIWFWSNLAGMDVAAI